MKRMTPRLSIAVFLGLCFFAACGNRPVAVVFEGVEIELLEVGERDSDLRVKFFLQITNTTKNDIPGMQVSFAGGRADEKIGPFWLPDVGRESRWAVKAGETRAVTAFLTGYGRREMTDSRPVQVKILGSDLGEIAARPEAERRELFAALVRCRDEAEAAAMNKHTDDIERQLRYEQELRATCRETASSKLQVGEAEMSLIYDEGYKLAWPPIGEN